MGPSGTTKSWSRPGSTSWAPGCRGAICPGAFGLCGAVYPRGWRRCARGRCARRLAVVPQGAIGKRRPTDGSPITLDQGGSNPPGRPGTQAIGRTKGRSNRPSDWANAHWPNRTPAARSVRQIFVPEPGDMSPGFASAANAALGGISTRKRRKDVAWLRSNPMERAARVCGRSRFARMRTTETGGGESDGEAKGAGSAVASRRSARASLQQSPFPEEIIFPRAHRDSNRGHEAQHVSALWAGWAWLRALWAKLLINLRVRDPG